MSRHTRHLRQQSRARKAGKAQNRQNSLGTAVLSNKSAPQKDAVLNESDVLGSVRVNSCSADPRTVIPGRDITPETRPGHRRQPFNDGWLWRDKILVGDLAVIVGDEGAGKTKVLADWIARVTTGRPFPGRDEVGDALPPSDVLVFNSVDDFGREVLAQVAANDGNPDRVLQASTQLLDWGHSHSGFPEGNGVPVGDGDERELGKVPAEAGGLAEIDGPETRVRLHTRDGLAKLRQFLLRRPSIRLVVIDQLKQHVRTDSERVFEDIVSELQAIARATEVPFIVTLRPDAFRHAPGLGQYFKSPSLTSLARGIWRVVTPDDPQHGHRVLQCLKLNHGYHDSGREPWRLWHHPGQPMRWELGNNEEIPLTKLQLKQTVLFQAKTFISLYLQMFGGLAEYQTLRVWARREGISASKLFEATMHYNLGYTFEPCADNELGLKKIIGSWDLIRKRQATPSEARPPVPGPPEPKRRKTSKVVSAGMLIADPLRTDSVSTPADSRPVPPADSPGASPPAVEVVDKTIPAKVDAVESLRSKVARNQSRLQEFPLEGFRFIKPNIMTTQLILDMEAELGSAEAMFATMRAGLESLDAYSADELDLFMEEYHRLYDMTRQLHAPSAASAAA